ncbi:MAG TPA: FtsX-like permease family protein [Thermoanaerobaculia bacterium]|nr:FtsX-like permease family protein [Thermoanaerobaculia bacterium]
MLLKALVLRPLVREKTRSALTLLGIAVGVAVVVAIALSNQSALRAFRESVDAVAGRANWQIASDAMLDEDVLLKLQPLWARGVRFAPVIDVNGMVEPAQTPIRILAVDLLSDLHFRDYRYARVVTAKSESIGTYLSLFQPDSVVLPASYGLKLNAPLRLDVQGVRKTMIVRGILEPRGPATAFNGAIAIVDIAAAQASFGMAGKLSRVDLIVPHDDEATLAAIRRALPPGVRLERPSRRNERVEKMLRAFRVNLFALAGVALLVGMFLVYNTVLISILRRRKDVGVFKTLGVSPRQIFAAFLGEGLVFGLAGSALGILLGEALAYGILGLIGRTVNALYVSSTPEEIVLTPGIAAAGVAVGTILSLVSAVQPSIEAARVRPSVMIRPGRSARRAHAVRPYQSAIVCFVAAIVTSRLPPISGIAVGGYIAVLFTVAGFSLLAPLILTTASRLLGPPMRRAFGVVGQLAAASMPASLRRTSVATAALALATGMMVAVAVMIGSFRQTVEIWIDQTVTSDLWLRPSKGLSNAQVALFPPQIADDLRRIPFIAAFDRVRGHDIVYGDSIITVGGGDFAVVAEHGGLPMLTPRDAKSALRDALALNGVMISESLSLKYDKHVGDTLTLATRTFPITGIYRDYSNDRGVAVMDNALYTRTFGTTAINTVVVYLKPGVSAEEARKRLESLLGPKYHAFAVLNREIRAEVMKIFDQTFLITYALLAIAIVVAVLGIINTLSALILERANELALLRLLGMSRAGVRRMIVLESSILGLASTAAGLVMGYALSWILIYVINKQSFGWTIAFHTPVRLIAASLAVTFLSAVLAGLAPARLAARVNMAAALKSE